MQFVRRHTLWFTILALLVITIGAASRPGRFLPLPTPPPSPAPPTPTDAPAALRHQQVYAELQAAYHRWTTQRPGHYRYTVARTCFCQWLGTPMIEVQDNTIVAVTDAETGERRDINIRQAEQYPTIDSLFAYIQGAINRNADVLEVQFDKTLGYPAQANIDQDTNAVDDEMQWQIRDFEVIR